MKLALERNKKSEFNYVDGALYNIMPPESMFGYTYHSHMIPPFRPNYMLGLGCGKQEVDFLVHKIWGDGIAFKGIDIANGINALDFVSDWPNRCDKFDFIYVDLWNGQRVCDFIFTKQFVKNLKRISNGLVCLNIPISDLDKTIIYSDCGFYYDRHDVVSGNAVVWWSVKK